MPSTIKDVARITGFSLSTISKYINGGRVKPAYAQKIAQAVSELNFKPNYIAKGFRQRKTYTIGVLTPALDSMFSMQIISEIEFELEKSGYSTIICDCRNEIAIERQKIKFLLSKQVDGLVIIPCSDEGGHIEEETAGKVPVVFADRICNNCERDAIILNNREVSAEATGRLLSMGKTAIITAQGVYTATERLAGYIEAHENRGMSPHPDFIRYGNNKAEGGYREMRHLWSHKEKPRSLFVTNYDMMIGVMMAVNELGIMINEDIKITSFDDLELTKVIKPLLTTVNQPIAEIGAATAKQILKRIKEPEGAFKRIVFRAEIN